VYELFCSLISLSFTWLLPLFFVLFNYRSFSSTCVEMPAASSTLIANIFLAVFSCNYNRLIPQLEREKLVKELAEFFSQFQTMSFAYFCESYYHTIKQFPLIILLLFCRWWIMMISMKKCRILKRKRCRYLSFCNMIHFEDISLIVNDSH
jgi:hypothetical protein